MQRRIGFKIAVIAAMAAVVGSGFVGGTTANAGNLAGAPSATSTAGSFVCTRVLGYSQTRQWYLDAPDFEQVVGNDQWELLWRKGAGIKWQNPNYVGWTDPVASPCVERSGDPDRVLLTIGAGKCTDTSCRATEIRKAVATIRLKYPNVAQILLQPLVGGPAHSLCYTTDGLLISASYLHPLIDEAIAATVGGDTLAGASPEVRTCSDYSNDAGSGHFVRAARGIIGRMIGEFYVGLDTQGV
jgi:hypothetical protein